MYNPRKKNVDLKDIPKLYSDATNNRILCSNCGHSTLLGNADKVICSNCGFYVFKNKEVEFKYRLNEQLYKRKLKNEI